MFLRILMGSLFVLILNNVAWSMGSKSSSTPTPSEPQYIFIPNKGNPIVYTNTKQSHTCLEADDINGKNVRVIDCDEAYKNHTNHSNTLKSTLNNSAGGKKECRAVIDKLSFIAQRRAGIRVGCQKLKPLSKNGQPALVGGDDSDSELSTCHTEEYDSIDDDPSFAFKNTSKHKVFGSCQDMLKFTIPSAIAAGTIAAVTYSSGNEPEKPEKKYCQRSVAHLTNLAQPQNYKNPKAPVSNFVLMLEDNAAVASSQKYQTVKSYIQDLMQPLNGDIAAVLNHGTSTNPHWMIHIKTPPISLIDASTKIKEIFANDTKNAKPSNQPKESTDCNIKMLAADFPMKPDASPDLPKMSQSAAFIAKPSNYDFGTNIKMADLCNQTNCQYSELYRMALNENSIYKNYRDAIKEQFWKKYFKTIDLDQNRTVDRVNMFGQIYDGCNADISKVIQPSIWYSPLLNCSGALGSISSHYKDPTLDALFFKDSSSGQIILPGSTGALPAIMLRSAYGKKAKSENDKVNIFVLEVEDIDENNKNKSVDSNDGAWLANWNFGEGAKVRYGIEGPNAPKFKNVFKDLGNHAGDVISIMAGYNSNGYKTMGTFPAEYAEKDYKNIFLLYDSESMRVKETQLHRSVAAPVYYSMRKIFHDQFIPVFKKLDSSEKSNICKVVSIGMPGCNDNFFVETDKKLAVKPDIINASFGIKDDYKHKIVGVLDDDLIKTLQTYVQTSRALKFTEQSELTNGIIVFGSGNSSINKTPPLIDYGRVIAGLTSNAVLAGTHALHLPDPSNEFDSLPVINSPNHVFPDSFFKSPDVIKILGKYPQETFLSTPAVKTFATPLGIRVEDGTSFSAPLVSLAIADMIFVEKVMNTGRYNSKGINSEYIRDKYLQALDFYYRRKSSTTVKAYNIFGGYDLTTTDRSRVLREDCVLIQSLADLKMTTKSTQYPAIAKMLQEFDQAFAPSRDECAATKTVFVGP